MNTEDDPNIKQRVEPTAPNQMDLVGAKQSEADGACAPGRLHVCFHCAGELVYPLDWSEEGPRHWRIVLRCPECLSLIHI